METGWLVVKDCKILIAALLGLLVTGPANSAFAHEHGKVRVYKLNSKDQFIRARWADDTEIPGCRTERKDREANRFALIGFDHCIVYAQPDCQAGSEVEAMWGEKRYRGGGFDVEQPQTRLLEGTAWYFSSSSNIEIRSWWCSYEP